jgi:hypothetical protein
VDHVIVFHVWIFHVWLLARKAIDRNIAAIEWRMGGERLGKHDRDAPLAGVTGARSPTL